MAQSTALKRPPQRAVKPAEDGGRRRLAQASARPPHLGFQFYRLSAIVGLEVVTLGLMSVIHAPIDQWYLAFVCMVPWMLVIGGTAVARRVYVTAWCLGFVFYLTNMSWMEAPTGAGYVALSAYLACYFPLAACPIRYAVRRRRLPLSIAFPIVWVGVEFLRAKVLSGFPWFFLGHSQYGILPLIQVSDLFGVYAVTFVVAAVNGAIADAVFAMVGSDHGERRRARMRRAGGSVAFAALLLVATIAYGAYRLNEDTQSPGPTIALIQQNYPNYADRNQSRSQPGPAEKARSYFELMERASVEEPDLFLLPETAWSGMHLNAEFLASDPEKLGAFRGGHAWSAHCLERLRAFAAESNTAIVIGSTSVTPTPLDLRSREILHNSAFLITPDGSHPQRHDKIHPVLFGESVPFRYGRLRFLYLWLNSLSPFGQGGFEYSLTAGDDVNVFDIEARGGKTYRFGVPICYEDVMAYVCRKFVWDGQGGGKRVDFLANISNDGWFLHSNELPQHFAICTFRAVENRVGVARTVNTGISGFIDSNGRAYEKMGIGEVGFRVARVMTDSRVSLYSRVGDLFAISCVLICGVFYVDYVFARLKDGGDLEEEAAA